ncbi:hypothetical protein B0A48_16301 [Cryoendolithus antarcticus]|uniref:Uncharacterized protein n=1 Tax=Cryoendolithus antarcticus TaxID=1507870 RepID=A0A1V8SFT9_9PEZI|nr:hypothetical protein B0A48_16301 [Cryoendolithus antarcticus]
MSSHELTSRRAHVPVARTPLAELSVNQAAKRIASQAFAAPFVILTKAMESQRAAESTEAVVAFTGLSLASPDVIQWRHTKEKKAEYAFEFAAMTRTQTEYLERFED